MNLNFKSGHKGFFGNIVYRRHFARRRGSLSGSNGQKN